MESSKLKETLEVLGLESFEGVALDQLSAAITKKLPSDTNKKRTLDVYVMWLHPRLMAIDVSAEGSLGQEIAAWYQFLKAMATHDHLIFEAFHDWQRSQAAENPTCSRRLSIAEAELRGLITGPSTSAKPISDAPKAEGLYGQMHPDRIKLSQESRTVIEIDDDDDDDNDDDDDVVVISSRSLRGDPSFPRSNAPDRQPDLSFLTGANLLAVKDLARAAPRKKDPEVPKTKRKSSGSSSESRPALPKKEEAKSPKIPPPNYTCDRCGRKGHFLKECPTNLDPAFDRTPPKNYQCHFCKKVGDHYGPMCPRHPQPDSIARQRREHAKAVARANRERSVEHRDRIPLAGAADRSREERQSRIDNPAPGRDRSSSPAREVSRHRHGDKYRPEGKYPPEDEFSRLSLSGSRRQQGKRKASRSPSPHKTAPRKKSLAWADDIVADRHPKTRRFLDDPATQRSSQWEGRLLYDDEVDEDTPKSRPVKKRTAFLPAVEKMDVEGPGTTVSVKGEDVPKLRPAKRVAFSPVAGNMDVEEPAVTVSEEIEEKRRAKEAQLFELEMMDMIRVESAKTNLLLLVDDIELQPICNLFVLKLFKPYESSLRFNQTINKTRACSTDFYEVVEHEGPQEPAQTVDCVMVAESKATTNEEQAYMSDAETTDLLSMVEAPVPSAVTKEEDVVLADTELVVPASTLAAEGGSTVTRAKEIPPEKAKAEALGVIEFSMDDESITNATPQEAAPATVDEKAGAISRHTIAVLGAEYSHSEAVGSEATESSPLVLVDDKPMEADGSLNGKPVTESVAEPTADAEMTGIEASPIPEEELAPSQEQIYAGPSAEF